MERFEKQLVKPAFIIQEKLSLVTKKCCETPEVLESFVKAYEAAVVSNSLDIMHRIYSMASDKTKKQIRTR